MFAYFCEFLPSSKRAMYLVGLATFWMVGQLIAGGFAWGVIGTVECSYDQNMTLEQNCDVFEATKCEQFLLGGTTKVESWRFFIILAAMPAVLSALLIFTLPESPKWLQSVGRVSVLASASAVASASASSAVFASICVGGVTKRTHSNHVQLVCM